MRLGLRHNEQRLTVELEKTDDSYIARIGEEERLVRAIVVEEQTVVIEIDGKAHRIALVRNGDTFLVAVGGVSYTFTREHASASGQPLASVAPPEIVAPMPGKVIRVLVRPGDRVADGDVLLILEAMKMENRLSVEAPGVVEAVSVKDGDLVEGGQVLVRIAYDADEGAA